METSKTRPPALSSLRRQTKVVMPQAKFGASREVKVSASRKSRSMGTKFIDHDQGMVVLVLEATALSLTSRAVYF